MEYVLSKFKIKPGQIKATQEFLRKLHNDYQKEMAEVLREANMTLDCSFIDGDYLYIFKRIEELSVLREKIAKSELKVYDVIREWAAQSIGPGENIAAIAAIAAFDVPK